MHLLLLLIVYINPPWDLYFVHPLFLHISACNPRNFRHAGSGFFHDAPTALPFSTSYSAQRRFLSWGPTSTSTSRLGCRDAIGRTNHSYNAYRGYMKSHSSPHHAMIFSLPHLHRRCYLLDSIGVQKMKEDYEEYEMRRN
jgi:hypothetical protein